MIDLDFYTNKLRKKKYVIFLFHGVIEKKFEGIRNYTNKHILKDDFKNLLIELKNKGIPISLDNVINYHTRKIPLPDYSFSITFDDGFENNYSIAKPILERLSIPATFYISTNLVDKNMMTWIDQIEFCIQSINNETFHLPWRETPYEVTSNETKIYLLESIRKNVKKNPVKFVPEEIVKYIFNQSKIELKSSNNHPLDKKMNWKQARKLHNHELFTIGGHSHNHISLGLLKPNLMEKEICKSIQYLDDKANIQTHHYSYPEGQERDFNNIVMKTLIQNNIKCCPAAINGLNDNYLSSLFDLKRIMVT